MCTTTNITVLGGPTVVLDIGRSRLIVDPTFDPPGEYAVGARTLRKTTGPAWTCSQVGSVDAVLLSHDQHPDNLDGLGRAFTARAPKVFTTAAAAERLGGNAQALAPWESTVLTLADGRELHVTAAPAQHGPHGTEHLTGPVTGFILAGETLPTIYVSGDNASLAVVREIAARCRSIDIALLFAGGAKTPLLGDAFLTLPSAQAADAVRILGRPRTIVVHVDGWSHFTQSSATVAPAFAAAGVADALVPARPGVTVML